MKLVFHCAVGQAQARCDLLVGQASGREARDLQLPRGERSPSRDGGGQGRCAGTLAVSGQYARASLCAGGSAQLVLPAPGHGCIGGGLGRQKNSATCVEVRGTRLQPRGVLGSQRAAWAARAGASGPSTTSASSRNRGSAAAA